MNYFVYGTPATPPFWSTILEEKSDEFMSLLI
jgi:hypothetical protein